MKVYGDLPAVECVPNQLNQVFFALLVNAEHAFGKARGCITIRSGVAKDSVWPASPRRSPPGTGIAYLAEAEDFYFEERMLQGLVIGYARCEPAESSHTWPLYQIDNWAVCDCFCWRLRAAERQPMWEVHTALFSRAGRIRRAFRRSHGIGQFRR